MATKKQENDAKNMDFVIVDVNGSQEQVKVGDIVAVNKLDGEVGTKIKFDRVLLTHKGGTTSVGKPTVDKAKVEMEITEQTRGEKLEIRTYKSKSRHRRNIGHRQYITKLKVLSI